MKRNPLIRFIPCRLALLVAPLIAAWPQRTAAETIYWDGSGTLWSAVASWSTAGAATTPNPVAIPGAADIASFNISTVNTAQTVSLNAAQLALGLVFTSTGTTTLQGGGTNRTLTLGTDGILKSGTGAATVGSATANQNVTVALAGDQVWSNTATGALTVVNRVAPSAAENRILTLGGSGGAASTVSAVIADNGAGVLSLNKSGTTPWTLSGANTFSGPVAISDGALQLNADTAAGTDSITLNPGGTTGTATRLLVNGGVTIANPVTIAAGSIINLTGQGLLQQTGTGQARINGAITINGSPSAGGHLVGGLAAGNELVLGGPVTAVVGIGHRDGRVVYAGGGSAATITVTNSAIVGANDGIPSNAAVTLGGSANATLDLNGFDQTLAGVALGNGGANSTITGTITLGAGTLTLNGNLSTNSSATGNAQHAVNTTAGGTLDTGAVSRNINVTDNLAADDLTITGAAITGSGGVVKEGAGTLAMNNASSAGMTVNSGTLAIGRHNTAGTYTAASIAMGHGTTLRMDAGPGGDLITCPAFTNTGTTTLALLQYGGALAPGEYTLIDYTGGVSPGTGGFSPVFALGHAAASLRDTGSAIALTISSNDAVIWDGTSSTAWSTAATGNWKLATPLTATDFIDGDDVVFADTPANNTVDIAAAVNPSRVTFSNTTATTYTLTGAAGINGTAGLTKNGDGLTILRTQNAYGGLTTVNNGTLELDHDATGNVVLSASSGVNVAAGGTLALTRDDGAIAFSRAISGAGTVSINPHAVAGGTTALSATLTGNNAGFSGLLRLEAPLSGTSRLQQPAVAALGSSTIEVQSGTQIYVTGANTYTSDITIAGTGFADASAFMGAMRLDGGANWAGHVTVAPGGARIGSHNSTGTISGNITGGDLEFHVTNYNNSYTTILTGTNSYGTTTIGGGNTQATGTPSMRVNIGNGGTTGSLGTGNVIINGDSANGVLRFDRSDGYTLLPGQTITGAGTTITRTFVDIDTTGAGFSDNGNTITLGAAAPASGGRMRISQSRPDGIANITGSLTAEIIDVASAATGGVLNINSGATVNANQIFAGQGANFSGTININAGATVNVVGQMRVGHFGTETSIINLNGGTVTLTGDSPVNTPSTAGGGGANATGDNNINALPANTILGGGIYLGNDGTGILNHSGGTLTTNWIVLDNRGATAAGANMADGIDRYNLTGAGSILNLRSTWGIIGRNDASCAVTLGGGTVRVDNTGMGTGTGANLTIPLDATITVTGAATLDTNGAGNAFTLSRNVPGNGKLTLTGGGTINLNPGANHQVIMPAFTGTAALVKSGAGTTSLAGSGAGYGGDITVTAGQLDAGSALSPNSITLGAGTAFSGEPVTNSLTLNGATLVVDPNTPGALTASTLTLSGTNLVDLAGLPAAAGPWTILNYTTQSGAGTIGVANPGNYRTAPEILDTGTGYTLNVFTGNQIAWSGAVNGTWNVNSTANWQSIPGGAQDNFFNSDIAVFQDGAFANSVTLAGLIFPSGVLVTSNTANFVLFSNIRNQLAGPTGITKSGGSTLTLSGPNLHSGPTALSGGAISIATGASLGNGSSTNSINITNGAKLTATAALDLGTLRNISVGTGGGVLSMDNAAAQTVTIPGSITGTGALSFHSAAAGAGTFVLSGDNSGYTGNITVDAPAAVAGGLTVLRIASTAAAPGGGAITLNFPEAGTTAGNATILDLPGGVTLPAAVALQMTSGFNGANSMRSQVTSTGVNTINSPVTFAGTSIVQFNQSAGGTLTHNGPISETAPGSFTNVCFFRGAGTHIVNGAITLPTAGSAISVTDAATAVINNGTNVLLAAQSLNGTLRLGTHSALGAGPALIIGQAGDQAATLDLNGYNQTVSGLTFSAATGNLLTKGISNSNAAATSTFTVNQATPVTFNGTFSGRINLVKGGAGAITLPAAASNFSGNVTINDGSLVASSAGAANGGGGCLGAANLAGRVITVNSPGALSFTGTDIFGNGVGNANLPATVLNRATLSSTRYNVLGPLTLNGGTLTQASTDSGNSEGYQFKSTVSVTGNAASLISSTNGKANHLDANTVFSVADVTAGTDLTVSSPLRSQSGDFGQAAGGFTKTGAGTMLLSTGVTHPYTGATAVNGGTLMVDGTVSASPVTVNAGGILSGVGTLTAPAVATAGGTVAPGASAGTLTFGSTLDMQANSIYAVEITAAATSDKLSVTGALTANGTVVVTLSGYAPVAGDTFDIADAASITGSPVFNFTGAGLNPGLAWDASQFRSTGVIQVVSGDDPFTTWASGFGLTGGKAGDDDGDGSSNLLEFATNADPTSRSSRARAFEKLYTIGGDGVLTLTIAVRKAAGFAAAGSTQQATKDKVVYTVEASNDLLTWNTVVVTELNAADSAAVQAALAPLPALGADWEWHSFRTDGGVSADPSDLIRLKVTAQP